MTSNTSTTSITDYAALFIGGERSAPSTSEIIEVFSPATGKKAGQAPLAAEADVDAACAAARRAFDDGMWPRMTPAERQAILATVAAAVEERADEFKHLLTLETG